MAEVAVVEEERTFEHFPDLMKSMRMSIIDRMQVKERCIFSGCSVLCNKEAKASKNYLYKLELRDGRQFIIIRVIFSETDSQGFNIEFKSPSNGPKSVDLYCDEETPFSQTNYDDSMDLLDYATEHFKNLLKFYRKSIRSLDTNDADLNRSLKDFDFGILNNLENLEIWSSQMEHILPKLRHPLKKLEIYGDIDDERLGDLEQIYQVQDELMFIYLHLKGEQLFRLSASTALLDFGELTVENIYNFVRAWQNGTAGRRIKMYRWVKLHGRLNFNSEELVRLLGAHDGTNHVTLTHFTEPEKKAMLCYDHDSGLCFEVNN